MSHLQSAKELKQGLKEGGVVHVQVRHTVQGVFIYEETTKGILEEMRCTQHHHASNTDALSKLPFSTSNSVNLILAVEINPHNVEALFHNPKEYIQ